jgi:hypothetical protein
MGTGHELEGEEDASFDPRGFEADQVTERWRIRKAAPTHMAAVAKAAKTAVAVAAASA